MNNKGMGFYPYEMRAALLTITSYEGKTLKGMLENSYFGYRWEFSGTTQLLFMVNELLDHLDCLQNKQVCDDSKADFFAQDTEVKEDKNEQDIPLARFSVRVLFRQNASLQGTVCWLDKKMEAQFRSVLELLILLDGALIESITDRENK